MPPASLADVCACSSKRRSISQIRHTLPAVLSLAVMTASAQINTANLSGLVTDPSGSAVQKAHIHVQNAATGYARDIDTDNSGFFSMQNLPIGHYSIAVNASGFELVMRMLN